VVQERKQKSSKKTCLGEKSEVILSCPVTPLRFSSMELWRMMTGRGGHHLSLHSALDCDGGGGDCSGMSAASEIKPL
jgi:hypothetical protein